MREASYALTGQDIQHILRSVGENTNIIEYADLYKINRIENVMINHSVVILYRSTPTQAHWCCCYFNSEGFNFFDPYGIIIDNEINEITQNNPTYANDYYRNGTKRLIELIINGDYGKINYNEHKLQDMKADINTCGRWCATRLIYKEYSLKDFVDLLNKYKRNRTLDDLVCDITNKLF